MMVLDFMIRHCKFDAIDAIADPERLLTSCRHYERPVTER
jgi:hypothetical protein